MPLLNMFRPRRGRSGSLPKAPEGYWHNDQMSAYGSRSGFSRGAHHAPLHTGSRSQGYPPYDSSFPNSGAERYAESSTDDQSWYRVEHPDYQRRGPHDRDTDYYSYSEEGSDRRSDAQPFHSYTDSESTSRVESPVPTVHRQETPGLGSRLFEQIPGRRPPPGPPASVTRLDLHEQDDWGFDGGGGFDQRQRAAYPTASQYPHRQSFAPDPRRPHQPHRRPSQHSAYQGPMHITLPSDSSRSDVLQTMEDGKRIAVPRQPIERRQSGHSGSGSYVQPSNPERTYYIVPPGMNVIFRDEYGNELKRVGDFSDSGDSDMYDEAPVELTDEHGRLVYKTGGSYTDDGSDASDSTYRPKVVHLGQYVPHGSAIPRAASPLTISLDRRGQHRNIRLEHSEDGSFSGGSQGSDRSFNPRLSHAHSEGNLASFGPRSQYDNVRLRTIYRP